MRLKKCKRVYISGPITGNSKAAERELKKQGYEVINPYKNNLVMPESTTHQEYMEICLNQLKMCDIIYMLEGWEESTGATIEFEHAVESKMTIVFQGGK